MWWRGQDLNLRTLTRADLQSAAIDHSATSPKMSGFKKIKNGAGEGNRTLTASLEGWNSTVELHPHFCLWWRGLDLNQRTLARTDLQSVAIDHSATSP